MERQQAEFNQGQRRAPHGEYRKLTNRIYAARKEVTACQERGDEPAKAAWIRQIKSGMTQENTCRVETQVTKDIGDSSTVDTPTTWL